MSGKIEIVGLGAGDIEQLPLGVYRRLTKQTGKVFLRTVDHPVVKELQQDGMEFISLDALYEESEQFAIVYKKIVATLLAAAKEDDVLYAVPGHPMLAEKTVQLLLEQTEVPVDIVGGHSYLDDLFTALQIDPIDGFQFVDGTDFQREELNYRHHVVFCQVYDAFIASEVKLTLLEDLPPQYEVIIIEAAGTAQEKMETLPLEDLDRTMSLSNLTSVYVPPAPADILSHQFSSLREVIRTLRSENGCAWDRKQTHESLREYAIEEVYELIEAINNEDDEAIIEELGDVLLQVMLHSQIGEDSGYFTIDDVIQRIHDKMVHRHPDVFSTNDTGKTWDELKLEENPEAADDFLLQSVVTTGPSLQVAYQLQKKAAKVGFDWEKIEYMWEKFNEEQAEFQEAIEQTDREEMELEFGDMLFVLANIAKHYRINPEVALAKVNQKFIARFTEVEQQAREKGKALKQCTFAELDHYWDIAKIRERE